jgi:hypothetical protein
MHHIRADAGDEDRRWPKLQAETPIGSAEGHIAKVRARLELVSDDPLLFQRSLEMLFGDSNREIPFG